ncbi:GNAT family N-acetyltransferase [Pontibacter roseus]|uniref:GNAT family N-acetyltransferase n=1 Tax=Pontibacter roseus TaxID=336989 RepID=UPI0003610A13|nr:GNAT family N-acetyltransferase [Pontibacter roseus]
MDIIHDETDLRFYADTGDGEAELTYTYTEEGEMDFDHTFVPEPHRGKGLADKLVKAGLEHAREKNCKVVPSCPVVEAYVKRHDGYEEMISWKY